MKHQYLEVGQDVIFVGPDKKTIKAKITKIYGADSVHIEWPGGSAIADYSDQGDIGTFHFEQASPKVESKK